MPIQMKRFLAGVIDHFILCFISSTLVLAVTAGKMDISFLSMATFFLSFFLLLLFKDFTFRNASIGKKLLKIKVVSISDRGEPIPDKLCFAKSIKRTLPLILLPVEVFFILSGNRRLGDRWANTAVINR